MSASTTGTIRKWNMVLLGVTTIFALAGWLMGRDPGDLAALFALFAATTGVGEVSSYGKKKATGDLS